jgi:hypothetical protein
MTFVYDGFSRVVEPYCHGVSHPGNEVLRGFQTGGGSGSGRPVGWKLFEVDKMMGVTVGTVAFVPSRHDYNPADPAMARICCHV